MYRTMLKSKIHRATVTLAEPQQPGCVVVDEDLMEAADLLAGERVMVIDPVSGASAETHVVPGERGSGVLGVNGAAARVAARDAVVTLVSYVVMGEQQARAHRPTVVVVDARNRPADPAAGIAGTDATVGANGTNSVDDATQAAAAETDDAARLDALIQAGA